jgi:hypothetical protein
LINEESMTPLLRTILIVILLLALIGSFPLNGYGMGYYGSGGLGAILFIVLLLVVLEKL